MKHTTKDTLVAGSLVEAYAAEPNRDELIETGKQIGKIYTDHGFPIDMALEKLPYTKTRKLLVLFGAQNWIIEHKRNSGATEKALDRTRDSNKLATERFLQTGESGAY